MQQREYVHWAISKCANELNDEFKLKCTQYVQVLDTVQITFSKVQYIQTNLILQLTRPDWRVPGQELG